MIQAIHSIFEMLVVQKEEHRHTHHNSLAKTNKAPVSFSPFLQERLEG